MKERLRGRPPKPDNQRKKIDLKIRLTMPQYEAYKKLCTEEEETEGMSQDIRAFILKRIKKARG